MWGKSLRFKLKFGAANLKEKSIYIGKLGVWYKSFRNLWNDEIFYELLVNDCMNVIKYNIADCKKKSARREIQRAQNHN